MCVERERESREFLSKKIYLQNDRFTFFLRSLSLSLSLSLSQNLRMYDDDDELESLCYEF